MLTRATAHSPNSSSPSSQGADGARPHLSGSDKHRAREQLQQAQLPVVLQLRRARPGPHVLKLLLAHRPHGAVDAARRHEPHHRLALEGDLGLGRENSYTLREKSATRHGSPLPPAWKVGFPWNPWRLNLLKNKMAEPGRQGTASWSLLASKARGAVERVQVCR